MKCLKIFTRLKNNEINIANLKMIIELVVQKQAGNISNSTISSLKAVFK